MDAVQERALIRGLGTFLAVMILGSLLVSLTDGDAVDGTPAVVPSTASPSPSGSVSVPAPQAWLVWVPGGLPPGFGDLVSTVDDVTASTTATADTAWMTASFDAEGDGVDQPKSPWMIPLDVTGVEPTFSSFIPEPERQLVQNLRADQGIVSESEANLRGIGEGSSLLFRGGTRIDVVGTLPDALMGAYELLVPRATGVEIGVSHERYSLFHVRPQAKATAASISPLFRDVLPPDAPYPAVEIRAPGEATYLRANDRAIPPIELKRTFGEFEARPDPSDAGRIAIDPRWVQDNIRSATLPVLGTVTCESRLLPLLKQAVREITAAGLEDQIVDVGPCFDPVASPTDPDGPLSAADWGVSIEINPTSNPPGAEPAQPKDLVHEMYRLGFGWGGNDAFPQGALFRYRKERGPTD